jgi:hypothetical protein
MKNKICPVLLFLFFGHIGVFAQCVFNPTIFPNPLILCPFSSDTLWTQTYDAYQWYHEGDTIPGATNQFLVVDDFNYAGSRVSVDATLNDCTERSPQVLVDGWVFLLPVVQSTGEYTFDGDAFLVCTGDTIFFEFMLPYDTLIQWTENGISIDGATSSVLFLTSDEITPAENYGVCGSPSICPDYVQCLGVNLRVRFIECSTAVDESARNAMVNIYPNPAFDFLYVEVEGAITNRSYQVLDPLGRKLDSGQLTAEKNQIHVGQLPTGIYFLKIGDQQGRVMRFIKK